MIATSTDTRTAESLIRDLGELRGAVCPVCRATVSLRESLMSIAMGFKDAPRCLPCLGAALTGEQAALAGQIHSYIQRHDCFRDAWEWACAEEGVDTDKLPGCSSNTNPVSHATDSASSGPQAQCMAPAVSGDAPPHDAEWNAGDMGCGDLVLELRLRLQKLGAGSVFKLTARDPGAPADMPAWCGLTGHTLLRAQHPEYWIERRD